MSSRFALTNAEQGYIYFLAFVLFNLAAVALPSNAPKYVGIAFFAIGIFAMIVQAELPSLTPPTVSVKQRVLYLSIATALTSVNSYIAYSEPSYWYVGLIIGVIGAFIAAIRQIVNNASTSALKTSLSSFLFLFLFWAHHRQ
jgi:hypothetical protein